MDEKQDRRVGRTRAALLSAFTSLLLEPRRYDQIKVGDIVKRANVGRSTFYEHFSNKDAILAESIQRPFSGFVLSIDAGNGPEVLHPMLKHLWQNRAQARTIFGAVRRKVARILAGMLQAGLSARARPRTADDELRVRLAAMALAEAQVGTLAAWLGGEIACGEALVAEVLHGMAQAAATGVGG
jgi:AcrR family transcriptional regulator